MSARVPWKIMVLLFRPVPLTMLMPLRLLRLSVPLVAVRVTVIWSLPASTSVMEMALPLAVLKPRAMFCCAVCAPGTLLTGASLTALTMRVTVLVSVFSPPLPLKPLSLRVTVRVTLAVASWAVLKVRPLAATKKLISDRLPDRVSSPVPEPATVTPMPVVALRVPLATENVAVTMLMPASTSVKLKPLITLDTSSVTLMDGGALITGASFTAATCRVMVVVASDTLVVLTLMVRVTSPLALAAGV